MVVNVHALFVHWHNTLLVVMSLTERCVCIPSSWSRHQSRSFRMSTANSFVAMSATNTRQRHTQRCDCHSSHSSIYEIHHCHSLNDVGYSTKHESISLPFDLHSFDSKKPSCRYDSRSYWYMLAAALNCHCHNITYFDHPRSIIFILFERVWATSY